MIKNFEYMIATAKEVMAQYPPIETLTKKEIYFLGNVKHTVTFKDCVKESEINRLNYFINNIDKYNDEEASEKIKKGIDAGIEGIEFAKIVYDRFIQSFEVIDVKSAAYYFLELNNALKIIDSKLS